MIDLTLLIAIAATLVAMLMALVRTLLAPGWFDRVLTLNTLGSLTIILLVLLAANKKFLPLLDIALLYALINFVTTLVVLVFFKDAKLPSDSKRVHHRWSQKDSPQ